MRSTRAEVARLAGVSPSVVSYVLNGGPRNVAPKTRRRVEEAIALLEYRPNAIAQALRGGRSGVVGLVVSEPTQPMFVGLLRSLQRASVTYGYALHIGFAGDSVSEHAYFQSFVDRQVDALIGVNPFDATRLAEIRADGVSVGVLAAAAPDSSLLWLKVDSTGPIDDVLDFVLQRRPAELVLCRSAATLATATQWRNAAGPRSVIKIIEIEDQPGSTALHQVVAGTDQDEDIIVVTATVQESQRIEWFWKACGGVTNVSFVSCGQDYEPVDELAGRVGIGWQMDTPCREFFSRLLQAADVQPIKTATIDAVWQMVDLTRHRLIAGAANTASWDLADL